METNQKQGIEVELIFNVEGYDIQKSKKSGKDFYIITISTSRKPFGHEGLPIKSTQQILSKIPMENGKRVARVILFNNENRISLFVLEEIKGILK